MKRTKINAHGLSLIECMMAVTVLTVTIAGLVMPFSLAAKAQRLDAHQTTAITLANQRMERLILLGRDDVLALDGTSEAGDAITGINGQPINHNSLGAFTRTISAQEVTITEPGADGAATFVRATVTVTREGMAPVSLTRLFGDVGFFGQFVSDDPDDEDTDDDGDGNNGHGNDDDGYDPSNPGNGNNNGNNGNNGSGNGNNGNDNGNNGNGNGNGNDNGNGNGGGNWWDFLFG